MKLKQISFLKTPIIYIWCFFILPRLPLLWAVKIAVLHMKWMRFKPKMKDKLFGEVEIIIIEEIKPWAFYVFDDYSIRLRDILYFRRRAKFRWIKSKSIVGTQCTDETAYPIMLTDHEYITATLAGINSAIRKNNERNKAKAAFFDKTHVYKGN